MFLPVILLRVIKIALMFILVVSEESERKLLRKMEQSNATLSEFISIVYEESVPLGLHLYVL